MIFRSVWLKRMPVVASVSFLGDFILCGIVQQAEIDVKLSFVLVPLGVNPPFSQTAQRGESPVTLVGVYQQGTT